MKYKLLLISIVLPVLIGCSSASGEKVGKIVKATCGDNDVKVTFTVNTFYQEVIFECIADV